MIFFKISLAIFYLRIVIRFWQRYIVLGTVILNTAYNVFLLFAALFNCGDPSRYLENELKGTCMPVATTYALQLAGCVLNAATDWIFALLPIFVLFKATMPLPAKVGSGFILLLACCGSIVSMVRIPYIEGLRPGPDFFNTATALCILSIIECGVGISAASAATLRPLCHGLLNPTRTIISQDTDTVRPKASPGYSSDTRSLDIVSPTPEARGLYDIESQEHVSRFSRWSDWSFGPVLGRPRIRGRLGITGMDVPKRTEHTLESSATYEAVRRDTPSPVPQPVRLQRSTMSGAGAARKKGKKLRAKARNGKTPARTVCKDSIRSRAISPPIPHIVSQISPPICTHDKQQLLNVDTRRRGSPDWARSESAAPWSPSTRYETWVR